MNGPIALETRIFNVVGGNNIDNGGHSVHFVENWIFSGDFGAGDDFLGVALVETIDKRLIFGIDNTTNR